MSTFIRETASSTATSTETYVTLASSPERSSSSQLKEATPSTSATSTVITVTTTSPSQQSTNSTFSSTTTSLGTISTSSNSSSISSSTSSTTKSVTSATYTTTPQYTQVSLSCSPSEFQLGLSTKCTVTVTASTLTPTGQVNFVSNLPGSFTPGDCTLSGNNLASCSVSFFPANTGIQRYYNITATYSGDALHYRGSSSFTLIVALTGATMVTCYPSTVSINSTVYCDVIVDNTEDFATPTGTVTFSSTSPGTFNQLSCNLDSAASCSVYYTPESKGPTIITSVYGGDNLHGPSSGTVQLTVN